MSKTVDVETRWAMANEIAALLRSEYVKSGNRAYLEAAAIALSRITPGRALTSEPAPAG